MENMCSCQVDYGSRYDGPSVGRVEYPKARVKHQCCECGGDIEPGEEYERSTGCWDGKWGTYKTCLGCYRLRDELCCSYVYGELAETVWEMLGVDIVTGTVDEDEGAVAVRLV